MLTTLSQSQVTVSYCFFCSTNGPKPKASSCTIISDKTFKPSTSIISIQSLIWIQCYIFISQTCLSPLHFLSPVCFAMSHFFIPSQTCTRWTESRAIGWSARGRWRDWCVFDHRSSAKPRSVGQRASTAHMWLVCGSQEPDDDCSQHQLSWYVA